MPTGGSISSDYAHFIVPVNEYIV